MERHGGPETIIGPPVVALVGIVSRLTWRIAPTASGIGHPAVSGRSGVMGRRVGGAGQDVGARKGLWETSSSPTDMSKKLVGISSR